MTVRPLVITSVPSSGTYFSARSRTTFEFMLKICFVAAVIATSSTLLKIAIFGTSIPVKDAIAWWGLSSRMGKLVINLYILVPICINFAHTISLNISKLIFKTKISENIFNISYYRLKEINAKYLERECEA